MKRHRTWLLLWLVGTVLAVSARAGERGSRQEAVDMVRRAVAAIKAEGREQAFAAIDDPQGPFHVKDLYVVVYDMRGVCLAHGANPKQIGKDLTDLLDADGTYFIRERLALAKARNSFWQEYKYPNPGNRLVESKSMYMERFGDLLVGCGVYRP